MTGFVNGAQRSLMIRVENADFEAPAAMQLWAADRDRAGETGLRRRHRAGASAAAVDDGRAARLLETAVENPKP